MDRGTEKIENLKDEEADERAGATQSDIHYIKDPSCQRPRLFLAIDLPAEIKDAIESSTRELNLSQRNLAAKQDPRELTGTQDHHDQSGKKASLKWTDKQNIHITMLFLGSQDRSVIKLIMDELPKRLSTCKPFSAELTGLGAFPSPTRPRVLWLGIGRGSDQMMDISGRLGDLAEALGIASRDARFHPHVTLARLKTPTNLSTLILSNTPKLKGLKPFEFKVTYISIFESILSAASPRYEELGRVYL